MLFFQVTDEDEDIAGAIDAAILEACDSYCTSIEQYDMEEQGGVRTVAYNVSYPAYSGVWSQSEDGWEREQEERTERITLTVPVWWSAEQVAERVLGEVRELDGNLKGR